MDIILQVQLLFQNQWTGYNGHRIYECTGVLVHQCVNTPRVGVFLPESPVERAGRYRSQRLEQLPPWLWLADSRQSLFLEQPVNPSHTLSHLMTTQADIF